MTTFLLLVRTIRSVIVLWSCCFCFQAEDGIRDLVRSRGLGDVYKRQDMQMPELDGVHATLAIRQQARGRDLPIIAMTGNALSLIHI